MPIPYTAPQQININNPSKEILGASGIYYKGPFPPPPGSNGYYAPDIPDSTLPNTGILTITTTTTVGPTPVGLLGMDLTSGNFFVDDMLVFNNYIHYTSPLRTFYPQAFLQQAVVNFNIYNLGNRS